MERRSPAGGVKYTSHRAVRRSPHEGVKYSSLSSHRAVRRSPEGTRRIAPCDGLLRVGVQLSIQF